MMHLVVKTVVIFDLMTFACKKFGTVFTTIQFLRKLCMRPMRTLDYTSSERFASDKHSSLLAPSVSYEEI